MKVRIWASKIEKGGKKNAKKKLHTGTNYQLIKRSLRCLLAKAILQPKLQDTWVFLKQTYYKWRKEYGGMRINQAKRLKELEKENLRLKKIVADQALDNAILKDVAEGIL